MIRYIWEFQLVQHKLNFQLPSKFEKQLLLQDMLMLAPAIVVDKYILFYYKLYLLFYLLLYIIFNQLMIIYGGPESSFEIYIFNFPGLRSKLIQK